MHEHFNLERHRRYGNNKHDRKRDYFTSQGGVDAVDEIQRRTPPNVEPSEWEKHIKFYLEEGNQLRAKTNAENRKKNNVYSRHGSRSLAVSRHEYFENSEAHEFPSLPQSFYESRCKEGEWLQDDARVQYEEMIRVRDLGANTPTGVAYTEEQILAMVLKGKQRGHIAGRGLCYLDMARLAYPTSRFHLPVLTLTRRSTSC